MINIIEQLINFVNGYNAINDKARLASLVMGEFSLIKDRSVYYCHEFAIRFSSSAAPSFGNTVLSLSNLQKVDDRPFFVCLVTPTVNYLLLANSTFLKKISHSSQELRENNIKGSFNGSDIMREFEGIANIPVNFIRLFNIHATLGFDGNLARLVEATNNISPSGVKYSPSKDETKFILEAPVRAINFVQSTDIQLLREELDQKVSKFRSEILLAALIENVNVRGRIIEYLIAGEDERLRQEIISVLVSRNRGIPQFKTENALGDYSKEFSKFLTATDVKTKVMILDSNPKAYNLDKVLEFLSLDRSVFMFYFVGIEPNKIVGTALVSMFQDDLLHSTILLRHWAGRNSRGVSQFEGKTIEKLILNPQYNINVSRSVLFLEKVLAL